MNPYTDRLKAIADLMNQVRTNVGMAREELDLGTQCDEPPEFAYISVDLESLDSCAQRVDKLCNDLIVVLNNGYD